MALAGPRAAGSEPACNTGVAWRSKLAQGKPGAMAMAMAMAWAWAWPAPRPPVPGRGGDKRVQQVLRVMVRRVVALSLALVATATAAAPACQTLPLQRLGPGLWWVPAPAAEADAHNRGHTSHLLLARDGPRLWAVGSGATPVLGQRLRCTAQARLGRVVTDLITPWAHAEVALGAAGLGEVRHWAHHQVALAMAEQCVHCVERLRQRLGSAAADLGDDPVRLPQRLLQGPGGRVGPFDWWVLPRAAGRVVTVLHHRASGVVMAPGLLWGDGPPDTRDADLALLHAGLLQLPRLVPAARRWVGESGPLLDAVAVGWQAGYLQALRHAAQRAVAGGGAETEPPDLSAFWTDPPPPLVKAWTAHPRHALNGQRAWRQAEDAWLRSEAPR